ncbi:hypothetical protein SESBI_35121 [Sesbania bispinosa]|nr:hypothetical protein SESBI_35121 [Sesbania bispinosa]
MRQQQFAKQQGSLWGYDAQRPSDQMVPNRGRNNDVWGGVNMGLSHFAWPPLQHAKQQYRSGPIGK